MRRLCATGLAVLLCVPPLVAEGPLGRSLAREASRLGDEPAGKETPGWRVLRDLPPETPIVVTTVDATVIRAFVSADGSILTVRNGQEIERFDMNNVLVVGSRIRRGSAGAAAVGALGGLWLGSAAAFSLAVSSRCDGNCGGAQFVILASMIGGPIVGGYGAWRATSRMTEEVIYRRPSAARP